MLDDPHQSATSRSVTKALSYQYTIQLQPIRAQRFHCAARAAQYKAGRLRVRKHSALFRINHLTKLSVALLLNICIIFTMTFEEVLIQKPAERAQCTGKALEEVLVSAQDNDALTVGVYECAKVMNL